MTGLENMIWENRTKDFSKVRKYLENKKAKSDKDLLGITDNILDSIEILKEVWNPDENYKEFIKGLKDNLKSLSDYFCDEKWNWDRMGHMREENKTSFFSQNPALQTMFYNFSNRLEEELTSEERINEKMSVNK